MIRQGSIRNLKKIFVLGFATLCMGAHAEYVVTYSGGTVTSSGPYGSVTKGGWNTLTGGVGGNPSRSAGPGSASAGGPLVAKFTWNGNDWERPDHIYVVEKTTATWSGDSGHCDDGLGGKKTAFANGEISKGSKIRYIPAPAAVFELSESPSADVVSASSGGNSEDGPVAGAVGLTYTANVTDYAVTLFTDCDESFHKGANGLPESNTTDVLTPRFGDTTGYEDTITSGFLCTTTFRRELIGGWINPFHEWVVDGQTYSDTLLSEIESVYKSWWYIGRRFCCLE